MTKQQWNYIYLAALFLAILVALFCARSASGQDRPWHIDPDRIVSNIRVDSPAGTRFADLLIYDSKQDKTVGTVVLLSGGWGTSMWCEGRDGEDQTAPAACRLIAESQAMGRQVMAVRGSRKPDRDAALGYKGSFTLTRDLLPAIREHAAEPQALGFIGNSGGAQEIGNLYREGHLTIENGIRLAILGSGPPATDEEALCCDRVGYSGAARRVTKIVHNYPGICEDGRSCPDEARPILRADSVRWDEPVKASTYMVSAACPEDKTYPQAVWWQERHGSTLVDEFESAFEPEDRRVLKRMVRGRAWRVRPWTWGRRVAPDSCDHKLYWWPGVTDVYLEFIDEHVKVRRNSGSTLR